MLLQTLLAVMYKSHLVQRPSRSIRAAPRQVCPPTHRFAAIYRFLTACGFNTASGYTAAINQLTFGAPPGVGPGDACGRCFALTATADPYSPSYTGPFGKSIVVKVTDECPVQGNEVWCGQAVKNPVNQFGQPFQ